MQLTCTQLPNGNLQLYVDPETQQELKEYVENYWCTMTDLFEQYSCNGSFEHFDGGEGNPYVGITSAPCIAERMITDEDGNRAIEGKAWAFVDYATRNDLEELAEQGYTVYTLIGEY